MSRASASMDVQLIANWLALPPGPWPPDHYTLLGLPIGESDVVRIEQSVHERLMRLRCYQLTNAAVATEAMTRLAKAFDCLSSPAAKKAYDQAHFPHLAPPPPPSSRIPTTVADDTVETTPVAAQPTTPAPPPLPAPPGSTWWSEAPLDWQHEVAAPPVRLQGDGVPVPPPIRLAGAGPPPPPSVESSAEPPPVRSPLAIPVAPLVPTAPPEGPGVLASSLPPAVADSHIVLPPVPAPRLSVDPLLESIRGSSAVRRGIELRRGLYERVCWLRRLQRAWDRVGRYLHRPKRRLSKLGEETDLSRLLLGIEDLLHEAPAVVGEPGQPGYRVVALAAQEPVIEQFKALDDHQRALLARDWVSGRELLAAYRRFLRQQILVQRHLTVGQRLRRRIDALLTDHFVGVLLVLGTIAILILVVACFWR